jgi:hypothetical protein
MKRVTQTDRNRTLLNILLKRPYGTFQHLKNALREVPINTELVTKMIDSDGYEPTISNTVPYKMTTKLIKEATIYKVQN